MTDDRLEVEHQRDLAELRERFAHQEETRRGAVEDLVASAEFDGGTPSEHAQHLAGEVLAGTMTGEQAIAEMLDTLEGLVRTIGPWTNCPTCGAPPADQERRNYDMMWGTADIYCTKCGGFVRTWDRD